MADTGTPTIFVQSDLLDDTQAFIAILDERLDAIEAEAHGSDIHIVLLHSEENQPLLDALADYTAQFTTGISFSIVDDEPSADTLSGLAPSTNLLLTDPGTAQLPSLHRNLNYLYTNDLDNLDVWHEFLEDLEVEFLVVDLADETETEYDGNSLLLSLEKPTTVTDEDPEDEPADLDDEPDDDPTYDIDSVYDALDQFLEAFRTVLIQQVKDGLVDQLPKVEEEPQRYTHKRTRLQR